METVPKLDEIDIKILKALLKDARSNFADIAKDCNVSIPAISKRYQKLKQNGVITGTSLILATEKSAHLYSLSVDITAQSQYENDIIEAIRKLPHVIHCYKVIGPFTIHAAIAVQTIEQMGQIKNDIKKQKGIINISITPGLDKRRFFPENLSILTPSKEDVNNG